MRTKDIEEWLTATVRQVRFRPDHEAIEKELREHYEDHLKDLERLGYDPELAAERSLTAMGDPGEVGRAMDAAHKPWLGWLWMASRGLLILLGIVLAWNMFWYRMEHDAVHDTAASAEKLERFLDANTALDCPPPVRTGDYRIIIERAGCAWDFTEQTGEVVISLTAASWKVWLPGLPLAEDIEVVDSGGVRYEVGGEHNMSVFYVSGTHGRIPGYIFLKDMETWPEWVEIRHADLGWNMRIDLPRREDLS